MAGAPLRQIFYKASSTYAVNTAPVSFVVQMLIALPVVTELSVLQGGLTIGPEVWQKGTLGTVMFTITVYHTPNLVTAAHVGIIDSTIKVEYLYAPHTCNYL